MPDLFVHHLASVEASATIGDETKVWRWSHVSTGAKIGKSCVIGENVFIGENVIIGDGVKIQNGCNIFSGVELEADVFCGPSVTFTNVRVPRAFKVQKNSYVKTIVRNGASIGAGCVIVCGVEVGEFCMVGSGSVVTKSIEPYALVYGNPAIQRGWVTRAGSLVETNLPDGTEFSCPIDGAPYRVTCNSLVRLGD